MVVDGDQPVVGVGNQLHPPRGAVGKGAVGGVPFNRAVLTRKLLVPEFRVDQIVRHGLGIVEKTREFIVT
ncbi:hypothetical protein SDC9_180178 [bioreactor metagenome]|uniref:Uncharacterized protein n=1 Tax=bioreactor metagenome TaxID=1076179 RepID=A0A645H136_9ZZZZ